jgi:hypothetical protein
MMRGHAMRTGLAAMIAAAVVGAPAVAGEGAATAPPAGEGAQVFETPLVAAPPADAASPTAEAAPATEPPAQSAPATIEGGLAFSRKTEVVDGPALQVVFGERAVFHLDDRGAPVLDSVEKGALAMAHPSGSVTETFAAPGPGKLAIALDGSPEKQASYLKIWNGLDHPVLYHAGVLAYAQGMLKPMAVKVCAAPTGEASSMTWPMPIAAAVVANFSAAPSASACN